MTWRRLMEACRLDRYDIALILAVVVIAITIKWIWL